MAVVMPAKTSPFDANPEQTPSVTKQENATVFRPDSRKKNVNNFPVQLFPVDSWQKFEDAFIKGQTNDHLHYVFEQMGVAERLGKGVFQLKLFVQLMLCCDTETGELILLMKEILNGIWDMYLKELDLRPLAEKIGEQVLDDASRKENLEFLLKRLFGSKGINAGLKILKEFCATYPYITKRIDDIMGKRAEDESLLGQELFTANITLDINMTESTGDMKMNIVVEDPKLLFDTVEDARKAVSSANDHKIIGALFGINCDTPKKNEGELHRNVLNRMLPKLVLELDVNTVTIFVQGKQLFHDITMRDILEQRTTSEKTRELIKHIQKRDPDTYKKFKECLVEAKQKFLKDLLEEEEQKILLK